MTAVMLERATGAAALGAFGIAERMIKGAAALSRFGYRLMRRRDRLMAARRARPVKQCENCGHNVRLAFTGHMSRYRATCETCTANVSWMAPLGYPTKGSN